MRSVGTTAINITAGTAQMILDLEKANAKVKDFAKSAENAGNGGGRAFRQLGDGAAHAVTGVQATSAALRTLEGGVTNNLRAAERFFANFLGAGPLLQKVFPITGGLAFLGVLGELGKKAVEVYDAFKKMEDAPLRMMQAFTNLNQPLAVTNDELRVANDRLEEDIAKLQGKPANGLVTALDEARAYADKLSESLNKDLSALEKLFQEQKTTTWEKLLGQAGTEDVADQIKKFHQEVDDATQKGASQIQLAPSKPGLYGIHIKADPEAANKANAATLEDLRQRYTAQIAALQSELRDINVTPSPLDLTQTGAGAGIADAQKRASALRESIANLTREYESAQQQYRNAGDVQTKRKLEGSNDAAALARPYQDKIHELDAQLAGLKQRLVSIGQSSTAETLAKSWAQAREAIAKLNDELAKHHQHLTQKQEDDLKARFSSIGQTEAEIEWKSKLEQTTTAIQDRIQSLKLLTSAIGEGYAAQKNATVETQVAKELGKNANDPQWLREHQSDVSALRSRFGAEYDAQKTNTVAQSLDKTGDQITLEKSLADAELKGAEAVREATLAFKLDQIQKENSTEASAKLVKAEQKLDAAQQKRKANAAAAQLQQEIEATNRLTAAQLGGADAVRRAQLENRIAEIRRTVPAEYQDRAIDLATQHSAAEHQQQVVTEAVSKGESYQKRLESIDEQVSALQSIKVTQGDNLQIEISLRELEKERAKVFAEQVGVLGSARDGLKAYFAEMATDGVSAAQQVHDALKTTFDSLNETLSKLVAGQKVNWASLFQSISSELTKSSLKNLAANVSAKLFPHPGQPQQQGQQPTGIRGVFGGLFGPPQSPTTPPFLPANVASKLPTQGIGGRDGQTPGSSLFVTTVDAGTASNPDPSTAANPADNATQSGGSSQGGEFSKLLSGATSLLRIFGGFRAAGGAVDSGMAHILGEDGPEFFIPDEDGTIVPNHKLPSLIGFDNTQSTMELFGQSLQTNTPGFLEVLAGSMGGGALTRKGGSTAGGGRFTPPSGQTPTWDPETNREVYPDGTTGPVGWTPGGGVLSAFGGAAGITTTAIGVGLGLLSRLFNQPKDHHFRNERPFYLPSFNSDGGAECRSAAIVQWVARSTRETLTWSESKVRKCGRLRHRAAQSFRITHSAEATNRKTCTT